MNVNTTFDVVVDHRVAGAPGVDRLVDI